ncbi:MAG: NOP5/NOP56 family protein [Halobacteriaceae archaeon]
MDAADGWFAGHSPDDEAALIDRIRNGRAPSPADWPQRAVEAGFTEDTSTYYEHLQALAVTATEAAVQEREGAADQQLIHEVRAMDDAERVANELAERVDEWAGSRGIETSGGIEGAETVAATEPTDPDEERLVGMAERVIDLATERDALRTSVERTAPAVAPNLAALAGPVLAARLIALAGGLESLAKMPSGTVQVLGAEDALFAHLRGDAPSPKHGVIYTHEAVRGTRPKDRGSAARALAGKLTIAARIDYYAGDRRPGLERDLADRIDTIRARAEGEEES